MTIKEDEGEIAMTKREKKSKRRVTANNIETLKCNENRKYVLKKAMLLLLLLLTKHAGFLIVRVCAPWSSAGTHYTFLCTASSNCNYDIKFKISSPKSPRMWAPNIGHKVTVWLANLLIAS